MVCECVRIEGVRFHGKMELVRGIKGMGDPYWQSTGRMRLGVIAVRREISQELISQAADLGKNWELN